MRVRRLKEQRALGDLSRVLTQYNLHQSKIAASREEIELEQIRHTKQPRNLEDIYGREKELMWESYLRRLQSQIEDAQLQIEQLRPALEREQARVLEARRDRRVLELLKEKEKEDYQRKLYKKERKELAEVNQRKASSFYEAPL